MTTTLSYGRPLYYRGSGKIAPLSTGAALLFSWVAVSVVGAVYAYVDLHVRVADKLSALILIAFAAAMGGAVFGVCRLLRVRSFGAILFIAVTSAMLGWYVSWVAFEYFVLAENQRYISIPLLFTHPVGVWGLAKAINGVGTFTSNDRPVTGVELWLAWGAEAVCLLAGTIYIPVFTLSRSAFCDRCSKWCRKATLLWSEPADPEALRAQLEARDFTPIGNLHKADANTPVHVRYELYACPACGECNLLSAYVVQVAFNKKGQRQEKAKRFVDRLWLSAEELARFREMAAAGANPPVAAQELKPLPLPEAASATVVAAPAVLPAAPVVEVTPPAPPRIGI
jgi:hypothetical protein